MSINRIGVCVLLRRRFGVLVNDQLVPEEIKVHPLRARAAFRQAENFA